MERGQKARRPVVAPGAGRRSRAVRYQPRCAFDLRGSGEYDEVDSGEAPCGVDGLPGRGGEGGSPVALYLVCT